MSIKDLFGKRSNQIVTLADADKLEKDVESIEYADAKVSSDMKFVPRTTIDFDNPKTFAKYGSAAKYYEDSLLGIINTYPYDGSEKEKLYWHNKATYIDNWIFENKYPKTTGHVSLNSAAYDGDIITAPNSFDGYTYRTWVNSSNPAQYITIKGGPHKSDTNLSGTLAGEFAGNGNILDPENSRESNLHVDPSSGVTIEFWWKKESVSEGAIECLFYLTNGIAISTTDWARLIIEHDGPTKDTAFFLLTCISEANGFLRSPIAPVADFPSGFDITNWNHYAVSIKNTDNSTTTTDTKLYLNGKLISSSTTGAQQAPEFKYGNPSIPEQGMRAALGAYIDAPAGFGGYPTAPFGASRSKFDEFRFWKTARTAEEIGRHWFTQVSGGTNTDDANVDLGVYYKFNEGILSTTTIETGDSTALDYSGRLSNGVIVNYNIDVRSTLSAIEEHDSSLTENKDPIMYPQHFDFLELFQDLVIEGQMHDKQNNSAIYGTMPEWIISEDEEDGGRELKKLTQVVASYFDTLHLQIEALPRLTNAVYTQDGEKPLPFAKKLLESVGFVAPELFVDASIMESLADRNETVVFEEKISNVKNMIYQNIYNNITNIYKSKGTEKSFRNLLRCFGVGDDLVKINLYGDGVTFKLEDNYKSASVRKNYLDYNNKDRYQATCYQFAIDANSTSFIAGSTTGQFDYIPFTLEADIIIPAKLSVDHDSFSPIDFTTSSLFGMHEANPADGTDLNWHSPDSCGFSVQAIKTDGTDGTDAHFRLATTWGTPYILNSPTFKDVYSNQRWNFAVRLKPAKANADIAAGTTDTAYVLEFYGVNMDLDIVQEEFTVTQAITNAEGKAALNAAKRVFSGAEYDDSTVNLVNKTDVKIGSVRYWLDYLDDETIKDHARDITNYGAKNPSRSAYTQTSTHSFDVLQADTLALYWNFETAAIPANGSNATTADAYFHVEDVSSGSLAATSSLGFLGPALKNRFTGKGDFYYNDDKKFVDRNFIFTSKQQLPEIISSSDTIKVLTEDDETFSKDTRPVNHFWAIEKSMYQAISDEMINLFASISDFNNLIGNPANRYRMEYKELGKLRQIFFDRIGDNPNIEKYIEFYKWLDSSVNEMLQQLIPASANFSDGMRTMIESHILERNKYWNKFPTLEAKGDKVPESSMLGINELFYNWRIGHATVTEGENSLWWRDRTERDNSVITSGVDTIDEERDNILHVATTQVTGSWMDKDLKSSTSYKGSTYALRNLARPYRFSGNKEVEAEDIVSSVNIANVPSPPSDSASFGEQHAGTYVENPTSVIDNQLGNYRFPYEVVQTSGRKNNNSWFNSNAGLGSSILTSSESTTVYGHYDFVPDVRTPKKHVFVERFSAPGSADTMQRGMLDVEGEEYSAYNSLNFRNLDVRLSLGEWLTNHHASATSPSFHKINKNTKYVRQTDGTCAANYDNFWVQHQIPQSGYQYSWINSSVQSGTGSLQAQDCPQGFATDYDNLAPQHPQIQTDPSSDFYGMATGYNSPLPDTLFHFDGNTTNASSSIVTATAANAIAYSTGQFTDAFDFNGTNTTLTFNATGVVLGTTPCADNPLCLDGEYTIDFWIKLNSATRSMMGGSYTTTGIFSGTPYGTSISGKKEHLAMLYLDSGVASNFGLSANYISLSTFGRPYNDGVVAVLPSDPTDVWHHIAVTRDSSFVVRFFFDGVALEMLEWGNWSSVGTSYTELTGNDASNGYPNRTTVLNTLLWGGTANAVSTRFNGELDEFRIIKGSAAWSSAFTPSLSPYGATIAYDKGFPLLNNFRSHTNKYELVRTIDKYGEEITKDNYPLYWSGSNIIGDDILSNDDWTKYESGTFTLNELMLHRNGPYSHPSWRQIRNAENPAVISMRNNNIISLLDKEARVTNSDGTFIQSRSTNTVNYIEPAVTWNKPIIHRVGMAGSAVDADLTSTYKNNLESFSNPYLAARLDYEKTTKQMYDVLKSEYLDNKGNITLKELKYSEYIFPKQSRTGKGNTRSRSQYIEKSGTTANGYDRKSSDIRTFWRDKPLDRQRTLYDSEYHTKTPTNALGARVRNSSVWALDYFKYMTNGEDCTTYATSGVESVNSLVATMRGDLAWAGFAQHRGFIYEGKSLDMKSNDSNGRPTEDAAYIIPPRPTLQFIHNPASLRAKEEGWAWKTGELSGNAPWDDSYAEYSKDINLIGKSHSLLPEFKISDHMSFYIDEKGGDFTADNPNSLAILGVDKVVATPSYYFSYDGAENNKVSKYVYEKNFAAGNSPRGVAFETLAKGVMHNTSLRDVSVPLVQEPSADIDSVSNWKSIKEYPVTQINTSAVTDLITPDTKSLSMLSKNKDQWMSSDLDVGFSSSEFKLDATKTAWDSSLATSKGIGFPVGYSPVSSGSWSDDHHWDQWENTFLMSFWVNLDKDGLTATKAAGKSIGCLSLHDSNPAIIPSDFFGLDDNTLKEVYEDFNSIDNVFQSLVINSMGSPKNRNIVYGANQHSLISQRLYDTDRLNKEQLEKSVDRLKNQEIFTQMHSEQASFYLSDIADVKGRACWVDTIGNKVYFDVSPYDASSNLATGQWNHVSILYLGGSATDDNSNMGYDARHHRVFLWVNNKLIPSEIPSNMVSGYTGTGVENEHPTNGTLHQYIDRVNEKQIASFGGVKGSFTFGKCDAADPRKTSGFSYEMNSAVLPGKVSDFALVRGEIGLVQDPEAQLAFATTTTATTYDALEKWDWLFNNQLASSTTMESSLVKDLYRYQSKDVNTVVSDWSTKNVSSTTTHVTSQVSSAGTDAANTAVVASSTVQNQVVSTTTYAANPPQLAAYWKMGIPSWVKTATQVDDEDFLDGYSYTDGIKYFNNIVNDHNGITRTPVMRLEVEAVKKLIPYNGFYPSQRAVQLGNLFYESMAPNVVGDRDSDPWSRARTEQALLQPLFAPGILFNSFKSGIAVDWAGYTGEYSSNKIDLRDKFLGSFSISEEESVDAIEVLKRTRTGRVILESATSAISRDVQGERISREKIKEALPKYIEKAKTKVGKEAQRFYKSASTIANFAEFEKWSAVNGKNVKSRKAIKEFAKINNTEAKYIKAGATLDISSNIASILGKEFNASDIKNPANAKTIATNIIGSIGRISSKNLMYGNSSRIGMNSPMTERTELDLEGTYLDREPNIRIPFEGLISPSGYLPDDKKMFYLSPSHYLEKYETGNWNLDDPNQDRNLYNNLRYPYFKWSGKKNVLYELAMHNFISEIPNFFLEGGNLTTFTSSPEDRFKPVEAGKSYYMDVNLFKSDDFDMTISPHDGTTVKIYNNLADEEELSDKDGNPYTTQGRYYGPALRSKSKGVVRSEKFYIEDPAQAPYTPPYFYGTATARLVYKPTVDGKPTLEDIHRRTFVEYINDGLDEKFASKTGTSGSSNNWKNTPAYRGRMPVDSSMNLFGKTRARDINYSVSGTTITPTEATDSDKFAWTIQTKFESPVLNFNTSANKDIRTYGLDNNGNAIKTLDTGELPCSTSDNRNVYGAVERDPRGVGLWSGYGEVPVGKDGLFVEIVNPSKEELSRTSVDDGVDTTAYISQLSIKKNCRLLSDGASIVLRDPYGLKEVVTIGQPLDATSISLAATASYPVSNLLGVDADELLYHKKSKIRTIYTSLESTEDNHAGSMAGQYDIEAYLGADSTAQNGIPRASDVANAICYHINYRFKKEKNFNWTARVKWVDRNSRRYALGASRFADNMKPGVDNLSPNFMTEGAIVELEWKPDHKVFKNASWRSNNPKLYDVPTAMVEFNPSSSVSFVGSQKAMAFYERSAYDDFGTSGEPKYSRFEAEDWFPFYEKVLSITDDLDNAGSLADICGFETSMSRVGEVANSKVISEAVVMIPYIPVEEVNRNTQSDTLSFTSAKLSHRESNSAYAPTVRFGNKDFFKISRPLMVATVQKLEAGEPISEDSPKTSISDMIGKMQKYNIPPMYDFVKSPVSIDPFVMYVFEFEETLNKQDLSDIWQGLMPKCAKAATKYDSDHPENKQVIEHELNDINFFEGKKIPDNVRWMTFKVKRKANTDYYKLTADSSDDANFSFDLSSGDNKPDYSYNWPYDYFSLVELSKISGGVSIIPDVIPDDSDKKVKVLTGDLIPEDPTRIVSQREDARLLTEGSDEE